MKMKLTCSIKQEKEFDIEFPNFGKSTIYYTRVDLSKIDYNLGKGIYTSSKEEFEKALEKAKKLINSI